MMHLNDEMVEWTEPTAFDEVKMGYHKEALSKLAPKPLVRMLNFLGVDSLNEACKRIPELTKEQYIAYLSMYEE